MPFAREIVALAREISSSSVISYHCSRIEAGSTPQVRNKNEELEEEMKLVLYRPGALP